MKHGFTFIIVALYILTTLSNLALAQDELRRGSAVSAECGNIIDGEFATNYEEQTYTIQVSAGDTLDLSVEPLGGQLSTILFVTGPTNLGVVISNASQKPAYFEYPTVEASPKVNTGSLSAGGIYTIHVINFAFRSYWFAEDFYRDFLQAGGIGVYTLYIGCTLRDSTVINAGDAVPTPIPPIPPTPAGSDLTPVTLPGAAVIPLISGSVSGGSIGTEGIPPYTYTFTAAPGNTLTLQVDRTTGNLNLGIVVLSPNSEVLFYGGLVASNTLSTTLTLTSDGQYTIGVFRVDVLPPAAPESTAFQVLATLNP